MASANPSFTPPTPNRVPNKRDPKVDHVPELRKRKERETEEQNNSTQQSEHLLEDIPEDTPPSGIVILCFDGACRRGAEIKCASGVFYEKYASKFSKGRILNHAKDSLEAEIYAASHAIITAQLIVKEEFDRKTEQRNKKQRTETSIHTFIFRGDSMVIANAIKTGDILRFDDRLKLAKQSAAWARLRSEYEKLVGLGFSVKWVGTQNAKSGGRRIVQLSSRSESPNDTVKSQFSHLLSPGRGCASTSSPTRL